ncbi:DinB family protein [Flavobacterium sp. CYK-55]|uniref:DinB family protein n=1 Tax=Flavobacterium sp. CYK-55 TaxID=2835529 RepID=UPI001BCF8D2E|nr:DinB family protein [Flavobacterium sp. CYK-55]MBS7787978.1 DinB family protein [Flavobacterium sp. CYK-55]
MEIKTIQRFLSYYENIRSGTKVIIQTIPRDKINWTYKPGKFTMADIIRHIAAIERYLFAEIVLGKPPAYMGCGPDLADGYEQILTYFDQMHAESVDIFKALNDQDLSRKINTVNGTQTSLSNFLRALVVHEIHHRAALCIYLNLLDIQTPPLLGLTAEQIIQKSTHLKNQSHE